tara:strand:+ start:227 stop:457 length:231 start_codon:yes stop_codon:yes gene_type:complete
MKEIKQYKETMRYTYKVRELIQGLEDFTEVGEATQMESMSLKKLRRKLDPKKQYHVEYRNKKDNFISTTISGIESK